MIKMMTETDLIKFYGPAVWGKLDETERMFLRQLHTGGNHRLSPDPEERAKRAEIWNGIRIKLGRRGNDRNGQASGHR
ncbi:MAG: hypothetical protein V1704_03725 [Candidatus Vogelbacteria bacterium]